MSKGFQFKQFFVAHDRCAMKVGTDGVLLGATSPSPTPFPPYGHPFPKKGKGFFVLDIGTGTGLVALMIAQRYFSSPPEGGLRGVFDAIDIVPEAVEQARENFANSPWAEHLHAYQSSLQDWTPEEGGIEETRYAQRNSYQLIVSNPPYFVDSLKNPDKGRETARHTDTLSYEELIRHSRRLLAEDGILHLILPIEAEQEIIRIADQYGLYPTHIIYIHTTTKKAPKRFIVDFQVSTPVLTEHPCIVSDLTLMGENGEPRSRAYAELCCDYYL